MKPRYRSFFAAPSAAPERGDGCLICRRIRISITRGDGNGTGIKNVRVDFGTPGSLSTLGVFGVASDPRSVVDNDVDVAKRRLGCRV